MKNFTRFVASNKLTRIHEILDIVILDTEILDIVILDIEILDIVILDIEILDIEILDIVSQNIHRPCAGKARKPSPRLKQTVLFPPAPGETSRQN